MRGRLGDDRDVPRLRGIAAVAEIGQVRVGEHGTDSVWTDDIDMAVDRLWRRAQEQTVVTLSADALEDWREAKADTLYGAATALGISRRMVANYEEGKKPIPRVVALATRALDLA